VNLLPIGINSTRINYLACKIRAISNEQRLLANLKEECNTIMSLCRGNTTHSLFKYEQAATNITSKEKNSILYYVKSFPLSVLQLFSWDDNGM
jgi:hypothetical protein